jgi:hypothetical protein
MSYRLSLLSLTDAVFSNISVLIYCRCLWRTPELEHAERELPHAVEFTVMFRLFPFPARFQ